MLKLEGGDQQQKMRQGKYEKPSQKRFPYITVLVIVAVVILLLTFSLILHRKTPAPNNTTDSFSSTEEKNSDSISIPGYEILELRADTKEQVLCMPNPSQNSCFFQISLYLEDGTLLWQSELVKPGSTCKPIVLSKTLEKGTYPNAVLRYSCYRMDKNLSPLNSAETKLTIQVN